MTGDEVNEGPQELRWSVSLWRQAPGKRWVILAVALGCAALGYAVFQTPLLAFVGFGAIMGGTAEFWLPLHFKLDAKGASVRCGMSVTAVDWPNVKRTAETDTGIRLSPLEKPTRLAAFRGVFLRYAGNREQVLEYVNNRRGDVA